ncbi:hypothetical protein ACOMHN_037481 [Nucella lapillus]
MTPDSGRYEGLVGRLEMTPDSGRYEGIVGRLEMTPDSGRYEGLGVCLEMTPDSGRYEGLVGRLEMTPDSGRYEGLVGRLEMTPDSGRYEGLVGRLEMTPNSGRYVGLVGPNSAEIAGYAYIIPLEANQTANYSHVTGDANGHVLMVNGTLVRLLLNKPYRDSQLNELLYVIIVIVFYATALMTLIVTQIKRQRREGYDVDYYDEYLQRNQEVKRTCKTATSLVRKSDKSASSYSAVTASSGVSSETRESSGHLLELPARAREQSPRSARRQGLMSGLPAVGFGGGGGGSGGLGVRGGGGVEEEGSCIPLGTSPNDSPWLESIPDIGT